MQQNGAPPQNGFNDYQQRQQMGAHQRQMSYDPNMQQQQQRMGQPSPMARDQMRPSPVQPQPTMLPDSAMRVDPSQGMYRREDTMA